MQAVEGLTRLIAMADGKVAVKTQQALVEDTITLNEASEETRKELEQDQLAISICQAMLNTALPVARFRVFVKIESGREEGREYTICAVSIEDVVAALYPVSRMRRQVYITLWEQRPTGADMLEGYQGSADKMRPYLQMMRKYSTSPLAN